MLHGKDVDFAADVFRPPENRPVTEPFYFARTAHGIYLHRVAVLKGILGQRIEDAEQAFALPFGEGGEDIQHRFINGIVVAHG